jgi:hypothetical protein
MTRRWRDAAIDGALYIGLHQPSDARHFIAVRPWQDAEPFTYSE